MCVVPLKCLLTAALLCSILTSVKPNPRFRFPTSREARSIFDESFSKQPSYGKSQNPIRQSYLASLPETTNEIFSAGRGLSSRSDHIHRHTHESKYNQPGVQISWLPAVEHDFSDDLRSVKQHDFPPQTSSYLPPSIQPASYFPPRKSYRQPSRPSYSNSYNQPKIVEIKTSRQPSYSDSYEQPKIVEKKTCGAGYVLKIDGKCVKPHVNRNIFLYQAPSVKVNVNPPPVIPDPEIDYNYVFIKSTGSIASPQPLIVPPPQQKTLVYVLNEESEPRPQSVIEFNPPKSDPEVFYVNYREGENPTLPGGIDLQTALSQTVSEPKLVIDQANIRSRENDVQSYQPRLVDIRSRENDDQSYQPRLNDIQSRDNGKSSEGQPVEKIYSTPVEVHEIEKEKSTPIINTIVSELQPSLTDKNIPEPTLYVRTS